MSSIFKKSGLGKINDREVGRFGYWDDPLWAEIKRLKATKNPSDAAKASILEEKLKRKWGAA